MTQGQIYVGTWVRSIMLMQIQMDHRVLCHHGLRHEQGNPTNAVLSLKLLTQIELSRQQERIH